MTSRQIVLLIISLMALFAALIPFVNVVAITAALIVGIIAICAKWSVGGRIKRATIITCIVTVAFAVIIDVFAYNNLEPGNMEQVSPQIEDNAEENINEEDEEPPSQYHATGDQILRGFNVQADEEKVVYRLEGTNIEFKVFEDDWYADAEGRTKIALAFNDAIRRGELKAPVVLGRDHHDVSGTDSPFRETSNIYDGSQFCADMAVQNVIGDAFRGATWVSIHNGGGVGWGEVINGGFGMVIDGSADSDRHIREMLLWDVNNGIARRSWARNEGSIQAIKREMQRTPGLVVTLPNFVEDGIIDTQYSH